ncbi:MAG: hypothetical protein ACI8UX_001854, partial [Psychromonas sp.]
MAANNEKTFYTGSELSEFEAIIHSKLAATNSEIDFISNTLSRKDDN